MLRFVLKERDGKERVVVFEKDVLRIGKSTTNDLILPEAGVSRRHAIVRRAGDKVVIEDLVSTNGTFVNGKRISGPQEIALRDKIFIAGYVLQLDTIPLDEEEPTRPTQMEKMKEPGSQPPAVGEKTDLEFQVDEAPEELYDDKFKTIALTEQEVEEWAEPEQTEEALKSWEESALEETSDKAPTRDLEEVLEGEKDIPPVELFDDEKEDEQIPLISLSEEDILDVYGQKPSQREEIAPEEPEIPPQGAWVEEEKEMPSPVKEELAAGWPSEEEQPMEQQEEILPAESPVADHDIEPSEKAAPFEADIGGAASKIYRRLIDQPELYWRFLQPGQDISERQNAFLNALQSLLAEKDIDIPSDIPREELIQRVMQETVMYLLNEPAKWSELNIASVATRR